MVDFSHLGQLDVKSEKLANYDLIELDGTPVLQLASASESNKPYYNALLKKSGKKVRAVKSNRIDERMIKENREENKELFSKYVIKGWSGILDSNGEGVEFSVENVRAFLDALPDWIFDGVVQYASDVQNFIDDIIDTEGTAKN